MFDYISRLPTMYIKRESNIVFAVNIDILFVVRKIIFHYFNIIDGNNYNRIFRKNVKTKCVKYSPFV